MWWDAFDEMERWSREMDRRMAMMFGARPALEHKGGKQPVEFGKYRPARCDVCETENKVIASFELPGADKKDIELNITDNYIEVKVEKKMEKEQKDKDSYSYAASSSHFYRRLPFPADVEAGKAKATYKDGLLRVEIPKQKVEKGEKRKIDIN